MPWLTRVLRAASWVAVCAVATLEVRGDIAIQRSARRGAYCWTISALLRCLFTFQFSFAFVWYFSWCRAAGNIGCFVILVPHHGKNLFALVGPYCELFLFHLSVFTTLTGLSAERLTTYMELLNKVDASIRSPFNKGSMGFTAALVLLILQNIFTAVDTFLEIYRQVVQDSLEILGFVCVCRMACFCQFLAVYALYLFLVYLPTLRMQAIERSLLRSNAMMGDTNDERSDFDAASVNKVYAGIFTIDGDGGDRQLALAAQRCARAAARLLEDTISPVALVAVVLASMRIFLNCLAATETIEETWLFVLAMARLVNYCVMLTLICETCQQFYLADARVTAALVEEAARAGRGERARELCAGLNASSCAPRYTACRLFVLERPLITSAIATAVTFTVMLHQLRSAP